MDPTDRPDLRAPAVGGAVVVAAFEHDRSCATTAVNANIVEICGTASVGEAISLIDEVLADVDPADATVEHTATVAAPSGPVTIRVHTTPSGCLAGTVTAASTGALDACLDVLAAHAQVTAGAHDAVITCSPDLRITTWNTAAATLFGWDSSDVIGRPWPSLLRASRQQILSQLTRVRAAGTWAGTTRVNHRDGHPVTVAATITVATGPDGEPIGFVGIFTDQTPILHAEAARDTAEALFATVVEHLDDGVLVIDHTNTIVTANDAAARMLHTTAGALAGARIDEPLRAVVRDPAGNLLDPRDWPTTVAAVTGSPVTGALMTVTHDDGEPSWIRVGATPIGAHGERHVIVSIKDVTTQRDELERAAWRSTHDPLTGLANRDAAVAALSAALNDPNSVPAVIFVDLDRFKDVNDSFGRDTGDAALVAIADRLTATVNGHGTVARLATDEFVIIADTCPDDTLALADALVAAASEPVTVTVEGTTRTLAVGASAGVAYGAAGSTAAQVIRDADVAMFSAKERGRHQVAVFDTDMRAQVQDRAELRSDLATALRHGELTVHYQPICDPTDRHVRGYEALLRWGHPTRGNVAPDEFIALAEDSGHIVEIGAWVLDQALSELARWRANGHELYVTVNVSARQLSDPHVTTMVADALARAGVDGRHVWLELTESAIGDETTNDVLDQLCALGVRIAIDDFGTGYSSLSRLTDLPVSAVKIDRSFVTGVGTNGDRSTGVLGLIVALARQLGLGVVAEGVETEAELAAINALGVGSVQGWLVGRAQPSEQLPHTTDLRPGGPGRASTA